MTVIQLLNKIANGEEVPKKIKIKDEIWIYDEIDYRASDDRGYLFEVHTRTNCQDLNEEIEILEEPKGIPEKLKIEQDTPSSNYYIKNEYGTKCALTKHSKIIADKVNEILDYLESKGDE